MTMFSAASRAKSITGDAIDVRRARQGLIIFAVFLIPLSLFGYWFYINNNDLPLNIPVLPMMFAPGLASIITRLLRHEGFADVSFRRRDMRLGNTLLFSYGFPIVVGIVAYGFAFLSGLAKFAPPSMPLAEGSPLAKFGAGLALAGTLGVLLSLFTSTGEEVGWRGYLLPRMIQARIPQPILVTSLIWGVWHLPVVFAGVYAMSPSHWLTAFNLMVVTVAIGAILAWLRIGTGSIWPCIILHATWNGLINAGFTLAVQDHTENIWVGETGILVVVTLVIAALLLKNKLNPEQTLGS
jgi:membrane protease YdiL (CAAX protease family)